ncbi:MAG TPA: hypothetical protein VFJ16_08570 [Longimicrobium sp.]|nr:hypothetical protein [Longimicrobium sp.]
MPSRTRVRIVAAAITLAGGSFLITHPARAEGPRGSCTDIQKAYMRSMAYEVCGSAGGTTTAACEGMSIRILSVVCNVQ